MTGSDGAAGYRLSIEVTHGQLEQGRIEAAADGRIGLRVVGLTGEPPLTPAQSLLLSAAAGTDVAARQTLEFLAYREKFLAGSWRFDTYFGRDTLLSLRMLMPALTPAAVDAGLGSVLTRLSAQGEVAHEEDIGERAVLDHMQHDGSRSAAPVFDYKMIDSSYLLAPVAVAWLLDDERGRASAAAFLAAAVGNEGGRSGSRGAALLTQSAPGARVGGTVCEGPAEIASHQPQNRESRSASGATAKGVWVAAATHTMSMPCSCLRRSMPRRDSTAAVC